MMDATYQARIAGVLHGLMHNRIVVSRGAIRAGNLVGWDEVSPEAMLAAWLQKGWKVDLVGAVADPRACPLALVPDDAA